ncbi:MAG: hypothetical protein M0R50_08075 [Candidatus Cloacimonetes bacterium]|jgi:DNA polymerase III delta prime subunit|nr:hypothetical protein [Candidatus Cloacimonadota bacterium]
MSAEKVRQRLVRRILRHDAKIHTLVELFEAMGSQDKKMREEIAETIAEILYPNGLGKIAEVIHPNGIIS